MIYLVFAAYCLVVTLVTLACIAVMLMLGILLGSAWSKNVFRAGDKTLAAVLGFSGFHSLSAECGAGGSVLCRALRPMIDFAFGEGHCIGAARNEGLLA